MQQSTALVLFSGGQDSAACLLHALQTYKHVQTIGFFYGQKHMVEMQMRQSFLRELIKQGFDSGNKLGQDHVVDLTLMFAQLAPSSLLSAHAQNAPKRTDGLPDTFVPSRNIIFLTAAATLAQHHGIKHIIGGMCESDYAGYPDCRDNSIKALQVALSLGLGHDVVLHTPLMWHKKAQVWRTIYDLGGINAVSLVREHTHSCYNGVRDTLHTWGYGCGDCNACQLRRRGYNEFLQDLQENASDSAA